VREGWKEEEGIGGRGRGGGRGAGSYLCPTRLCREESVYTYEDDLAFRIKCVVEYQVVPAEKISGYEGENRFGVIDQSINREREREREREMSTNTNTNTHKQG
jgi:hypothetical protein